MKVCLKTTSAMVMEELSILGMKCIKETWSMAPWKVKVLICGQMDEYSVEIGNKVKNRVSASSCGQMVRFTKVNSRMTSKMAKVLFTIQMVRNTRASGERTRSMARATTNILMAQSIMYIILRERKLQAWVNLKILKTLLNK